MAVAAPLAVHRDTASLVQGTDPRWRTQLLGLASLPRTVLFGERGLPDDDHALFPIHCVAMDVVPTPATRWPPTTRTAWPSQ